MKHITARLKTFTETELLEAIARFKGSEWWMKHNAHQGAAWFFNSDRRIDQFLNIEPEKSEHAPIIDINAMVAADKAAKKR